MLDIMAATASSDNALVSHSLQEERRGVKRKISLASCDVCEREEAKYRCPNCLKYSCSLACVKQHKRCSGCSGVRNQTAFVRLSQFEEINLLNDYRFLEETARVADMPRRDALLQEPHRQTRLALVRRNARAAKVNLKVLPKSFTRHKENTTFYSKAERKLYWFLKLLFPQCNAEYTDRVAEDQDLQHVLGNYIHPTESDPVKRQRLNMYVPAYPDQLCVFMKSEQRRADSLRYHELDVRKTLRENLMFKTVLEYPEVHVVLKEHRAQYLVRIPGRSGGVTQGDRPGGSSCIGAVVHLTPPAAPQDVEALTPRESRTQGMAAEVELEEGEIRSDEEEEEDEHKCGGADGAYQNVTMATNNCLPYDVKEGMDDDNHCDIAKDQSITTETHIQDGDIETSVAAVKDLTVTMETDGLPLSPDGNVVDVGSSHLSAEDCLGDPNVQHVEGQLLLHGGKDEVGEDQQSDLGKDFSAEDNCSVETRNFLHGGGEVSGEVGSGVVCESHISDKLPLDFSGGDSEHAESESRDPCDPANCDGGDDDGGDEGRLLPGGCISDGAGLAKPNEVTRSDECVYSAPIPMETCIASGDCSQDNGRTEAPLVCSAGDGEAQTLVIDVNERPPPPV